MKKKILFGIALGASFMANAQQWVASTGTAPTTGQSLLTRNTATGTYNPLTSVLNGKIGIGFTAVSSPLAQLHVIASGTLNANFPATLIANTATSTTASIIKKGLEISSTGNWNGSGATNIGLHVSSVTGGIYNYDAIFNGGGNVGIGTNAPSEKLHIYNTTAPFVLLESNGTANKTLAYKIRTFNQMAQNTYIGYGSVDDGLNSSRAAIFVPNSANNGVMEALSILKSTGNVGIGTITPTEQLEIVKSGGGSCYIKLSKNSANSGEAYGASGLLLHSGGYIYQNSSYSYGTNRLVLGKSSTSTQIAIDENQIYFGSDPSSTSMSGNFNFNGKLWATQSVMGAFPSLSSGYATPSDAVLDVIGKAYIEQVVVGRSKVNTTNNYPNGYRMYVEDGILTEKVKVSVKTTSDWSDFVFADGYKLQTLNEVDQYIKTNKHLPGVPSAQDMVNHGLDVAKTDAILLQKIEELTLHMIEMQKQNAKLANRVAELEK